MGDKRDTGSRAWYLLLLLPLIGLLWVPLYAKETPELFGFPFFYWYQFAWVPLSVVITFFVYTRTRTLEPRAKPPGGGSPGGGGAPPERRRSA